MKSKVTPQMTGTIATPTLAQLKVSLVNEGQKIALATFTARVTASKRTHRYPVCVAKAGMSHSAQRSAETRRINDVAREAELNASYGVVSSVLFGSLKLIMSPIAPGDPPLLCALCVLCGKIKTPIFNRRERKARKEK